MRAVLLVVALLAGSSGCRGDEQEDYFPSFLQGHEDLPPPIWHFESAGTSPCVWSHAFPFYDLATFPMGCDEADVAWRGRDAIVWLHQDERTPRDGLYLVTIGGSVPPIAIPSPKGRLWAVGWDDDPLAITFGYDERDVTAWSYDGAAWTARERGTAGIDALATWTAQHGQTARNHWAPPKLTPVVGPVDGARGEAQAIADLSAGLERTPLAANTPITVTLPDATWSEFDAGGVRMAIRSRDGRVLPDVRRYEHGAWQKLMVGANVDDLRAEIWRAGLEIRGAWFILSSAGRGASVIDARTGTRLFGFRDTALTLYAPLELEYR